MINIREVLGKYKNKEDREKNDFYATPPKEVKNILRYENLKGNVLDNSCGGGHIIKTIKEIYPDKEVIATDLIDRGFGETNLDFLNENYPYDEVDNIVINPPFKLITEFIEKSLNIANNKLIVLGRLQVLESIKRYKRIFKENPPSRIYIYVDRIIIAKNGNFKNYSSSNMAFAWFVWDFKDKNKNTELTWIRKWEKSKFNKVDDN